MGTRLCALAMNDPSLALIGAVARDGSRAIHTPAAPGAVRIAEIASFPADFRADVVIDFSSDAGAITALSLAQRAGAALLVGTTALSAATLEALRRASTQRAVLVASNTSRGVAVTAAIVQTAARLYGPAADVSIFEAHHRAKKDAPSGTAIRLANAVKDGGLPLSEAQVVSIRGGDVIGEHTVRLAADGEYIEITHRATSRDLFARGALDAAKWLAAQPPGWWTMNDVLGLSAR
jgi:4-hydroxy-tetrahydrodipicolinate reductase